MHYEKKLAVSKTEVHSIWLLNSVCPKTHYVINFVTDRHDIAEILLKVALNTTNQTNHITVETGAKIFINYQNWIWSLVKFELFVHNFCGYILQHDKQTFCSVTIVLIIKHSCTLFSVTNHSNACAINQFFHMNYYIIWLLSALVLYSDDKQTFF
jgi:hypothetical protein